MKTVQHSTLSNGIRVVSEAMPHLETASVGVWVDVGARYEDQAINGISHMLEHMAFKGTTTRSARRIAEEIENAGGYLNAYTTREHTTYYARVLKDDVALAVDLLGDILTNPRFDDVELAREKDVIIQEIGGANDTPDDLVFEMLQETAYPNQPIGRSILGTPDRVRAISRDDLIAFMATHYTGENMVIAAAGNIDHDALVPMLEDAFGRLPSSASRLWVPATYQGGTRMTDRTLEQVHVCFGLNSLAFDHPDYFALQVYSMILGGGMSSRLFQEIREERGLAYSIYSFVSPHADAGLFGVYAGTHPSMVAGLAPLVADEMKKMLAGASDEEMIRARAQLKAGLLMSLESTSARIEQLGRQMLIFDRDIPTAELVQEIDAVDVDAVRRVAEETLASQLSVAGVGQGEIMGEHERLAGMFSLTAA